MKPLKEVRFCDWFRFPAHIDPERSSWHMPHTRTKDIGGTTHVMVRGTSGRDEWVDWDQEVEVID